LKVVILAGGLGTRFGKMTSTKPKPMIKIGEYPILLHIIKYFKSYGFNEFFIALGYKGEIIRKYFKNLKLDDVKIHLVDTGVKTMTGGRLKKFENLISDDNFMLTYGDGLCNVNLKKLIKFHKKHNKISTVTAVHPPGRFGNLDIKNSKVISFNEKHQLGESWINGGYFVFEPSFFDLIEKDETMLEREPLEIATSKKELFAYKHDGFWQCMDTARDREILEKLYTSKDGPWANL